MAMSFGFAAPVAKNVVAEFIALAHEHMLASNAHYKLQNSENANIHT